MSSLNDQQMEAVRHTDGPLLVLAGAGSGKTRIVTQRIAHLIERGVPSHAILGLTFTNKAAEEMQHRVRSLTSQAVLICTFHSLGVRILRESIEALGISKDFTIYDEEDAHRVLKLCLDFFGLKDKEFSPKVFKGLISHAKNQLLPPSQVEAESGPVGQWFPKIYVAYQERLVEYQALDFDDLLFLTVKLLQEHPHILSKMQDRWRFLLVDEYQDTNHAQYLMASLLAAKSRNLFVVGDPDQSIYSWRGANIRNILNFQSDYKDAKLVRLEQNYRSTTTILDAANALIANNIGRLKKNLWSSLGQGSSIVVYHAPEERTEAEFVISQILDLNYKEGISFNETVIFYRTNAQSRLFEDAFLKRRIPYLIIGGISFYQRREIKDILALLRLIHSPSDFVSFARTINLPKRGLGEATLDRLRFAATQMNQPILEACKELVQGKGEPKLSAKQREGLAEYLQIFEAAHSFHGPLHELVSLVIRKSRYLDHLKEDKESFEERKSNVEELIAKATEWEDSHQEGALGSFLEELSLKSTLDEATPYDKRVHLMTVHNGKGLEYTTAFLVGMEEDLFPHANARGDSAALEEERRLCYVGMTRAKRHLFLTCAQMRFIFGSTRFMRPSRFLKEIPDHLITKKF